jgi:hypothetical protein
MPLDAIPEFAAAIVRKSLFDVMATLRETWLEDGSVALAHAQGRRK